MDHVRLQQAFAALRITLAILLFLHGAARVWLGGVAPFGVFLSGQGFGDTLGLAIAWAVTLYELTATFVLAMGPRRWVPPVALGFSLVYATGIALVHWPHGWFVVGAGRNGMEYSVLLISCLLLVAFATRPPAAR